MTEPLQAPFPYFGGKSRAGAEVWQAFGAVDNYVEPFAGSAAMLLAAPPGNRIETINDADGFVANFWRAISSDAHSVALYADYPCNETDLFARHGWLMRNAGSLLEKLHADPEYYNPQIAGWWVWGLCNWIGDGWCAGDGPWRLVDGVMRKADGDGTGIHYKHPHLGHKGIGKKMPHLGDSGQGIAKQLPHLGDAGRDISRRLPHLDAPRGINRQPEALTRSAFIQKWFANLQARLREVRVTCGDWRRVVKESVTVRHGLTAVFLDPPYSKGGMQYAAGGTGTDLAVLVQAWCRENGGNSSLRIVLCGHAGEHDGLLESGWSIRTWKARKGYALNDEAVANAASETLWCSPNCMPAAPAADLFNEAF